MCFRRQYALKCSSREEEVKMRVSLAAVLLIPLSSLCTDGSPSARVGQPL